MSQTLTSPPSRPERQQLEKLCSSIRGKLQFMDYLVRAAVADVDRFQGESDAGTRIFLRQLIEMHASNLSVECENMRLMGELCNTLETTVTSTSLNSSTSFRNGDAA
ncbi:MAG: hypothetical protein JWN86_2905 [Planctomycetota bacterium]|nr:hypothetical protein [Planctomycetota bacterium]